MKLFKKTTAQEHKGKGMLFFLLPIGVCSIFVPLDEQKKQQSKPSNSIDTNTDIQIFIISCT